MARSHCASDPPRARQSPSSQKYRSNLRHPESAIASNDASGCAWTVILEVSLPRLFREDAPALADKAHQVCPYSNATRGNIDVEVLDAAD